MKKRQELFGLVVLVVFVLSICFSSAAITKVVSEGTTSAVVTSYIRDQNRSLFEQSKRIWEISSSSIELGQTLELMKDDSIKMIIQGDGYYVYVKEISDRQIELVTLDNQTIILTQSESRVFEIINFYTDERTILEFTLKSIRGEIADVHIQTYNEKKAENVNYEVLFDIEVELPNKQIYSTADLDVYINFYNFGEGPSHINIEYTIRDSHGKEYYKGIDDKLVYTQDSLIKNFNFLKLDPGKYTVAAKISYGKNQTAYSENNFSVLPISQFSRLKPLIILGLILAFIISALYFRRIRKKESSDD